MRWLKFTLALLALFIVGNVISDAAGPSSGYTGAPNENNCTSCHSGTSLVTSGANWNRVRMSSNIPSTGYLMDSTYTITLTYAETGISKFGFQLTALSSDSAKAAGTFATTDARTQKNTGSVGGLTRYYIEHTATGNSKVATDSTSWVFKWKAPSKNMGSIVFYVNVNAANGNGSSSGDVIYGKSFKILQSSKLPVATARLVDTPACANGFRFAGTATNNPSSFEWFTFDAFGKYKLLSNQQNPTFSQLAGSVNNVIYFKAYNSLGESNTVKLIYTVNDSPVKPKVSPVGSNYVCSGDSLKLTASSQSALGYTQRWLPINNAKLSLFVKDSGYYISESKNKIGCITLSDTIRLFIKKRPTITADFIPNKSAYCAGSLVLLNARGKYADSFGTNAKGPFKADSSIALIAKSGNSFVNVYSKSVNGCISPANKKNYVVLDSSFKVQAATFDLSLTSVTFRWINQLSAIQYEVSKDSGKTWTKTGNSGKDTFYKVSASNAFSLLKLWVRYSVNTDCGFSPIANFSSYTNACQEVKITFATDTLPSCVGQTQTVILGNLPQRYGIWLNGQSKGQVSSVTVSLNRRNTPLQFEILDSNQLVCGAFKSNYSLLADSLISVKSSWDTSSVLATCAHTSYFSVVGEGDVAKIWSMVNNRKTPVDLKLLSGNVKFSNGDSLQIMAKSPRGCVVTSKKVFVKLMPKPDPTFTYSVKKIGDSALIELTPKNLNAKHLWYIQSKPGWFSPLAKPTINAFPFRTSPTVVIYHEVQSWGDSCFSMDSSLIDLVPYFGRVNPLSHVQFSVYPNPQKREGEMVIFCNEKIQELQLFDAIGKRIMIKTGDLIQLEPLKVPKQPGIYLLQCKTISGILLQKQIQVID